MLFYITPWTWARPRPRTPAAVAGWRRVLWKSGILPVAQTAYRTARCSRSRRPSPTAATRMPFWRPKVDRSSIFSDDDDARRLRHRRCARPGRRRRNRARPCVQAGRGGWVHLYARRRRDLNLLEMATNRSAKKSDISWILSNISTYAGKYWTTKTIYI